MNVLTLCSFEVSKLISEMGLQGGNTNLYLNKINLKNWLWVNW